MSLYDLKVELVRSIPLKQGNNAMRHSSDYVKNSQTGMETVVPPLATLFVMICDNGKEAKVMPYFDSPEK